MRQGWKKAPAAKRYFLLVEEYLMHPDHEQERWVRDEGGSEKGFSS
jgi:hypothetical protein